MCTPRGCSLFVTCISGEQLQGVRQQLNHRRERLYRTIGTARNIYNQRSSANSTNPATQSSKRGLLDAFSAHALANALNQTVTHGASSLRSDVTQSNPRAPSCHHQPYLVRTGNECLLDFSGFVRDHQLQFHSEAAV